MDMSGGGAAGHARRSAVPPSVVSQRSERKVPYRVILAAIWLTLASLAAVWLLYRWKHLIFYLVMAGFIALVLNRPIQTLERWGLSRGPAILAVSAVALVLFLGLVAAVAAPITTNGVNFAKHAPQYLRQAQEGRGPVGAVVKRFHLQKQVNKINPGLSRILATAPERVVGVLQSAASTAFSVGIVVILAIFMLAEGPSLVAAVLAGLPGERRERVRRVGVTISRVVSGYTVGVVFMAILYGLVTAAALALTGVPFITSLAVWAGLLDIIPVIGDLIGMVPAAIFAFTHSLVAGIVVVAAMLAIQQVKNHVLYPIIVGRAVNLNALLVLVAVLAGSELMGIPGAVLAIPVAGTLQAIFVEFAPPPVRMFLRHPEMSRPSTPPPEDSGRGAPAIPSGDGDAGEPDGEAGEMDGEAAGVRPARRSRRRRR